MGNHTVCSIVSPVFLDFSLLAGNDLSRPRPEWGFLGLLQVIGGVSAQYAGLRRTVPAALQPSCLLRHTQGRSKSFQSRRWSRTRSNRTSLSKQT